VLIVDDNADMASGLSRLLGALGHQVDVAADGPAGVEAARRNCPDVILLDIGLPGMDGYEVARRLRGEGMTDTLIVAVSGYDGEEDRRRSLESGMDHHLPKPVNLKTLLTLIGERQRA
jgi:CheY-like chemotaxis protein